MSKKFKNWGESMADALTSIDNLERFEIYKPWRLIFKIFGVLFMRFAVLTLFSATSVYVIPFLVAPWAMCLYEFYIILKRLDKFGISPVKVLIFFALCEAGLAFVSPFIVKGIWFVVSCLISGRLFG